MKKYWKRFKSENADITILVNGDLLVGKVKKIIKDFEKTCSKTPHNPADRILNMMENYNMFMNGKEDEHAKDNTKM